MTKTQLPREDSVAGNSAAREAFYAKVADLNVSPLWTTRLVPPRPKDAVKGVAHRWDFDNVIRRDVGKRLRLPGLRPVHRHLIDFDRLAETEVLAQSILRSVAVAEHDFAHLRLAVHFNVDARAYCIAIRLRAHQFHLQPMAIDVVVVLQQRMRACRRGHRDVAWKL